MLEYRLNRKGETEPSADVLDEPDRGYRVPTKGEERRCRRYGAVVLQGLLPQLGKLVFNECRRGGVDVLVGMVGSDEFGLVERTNVDLPSGGPRQVVEYADHVGQQVVR